MQHFIVGSIIGFGVKLFYNRTELAPFSKLTGLIVGSLLVALFYYNYKKYDNKYWKYWEHWKDEPKEKWTVKGWLVLLVIVVPILMFYSMAVI
jgi:high-affinity Fe2+/Pb2+ permease